MTKLTKTLSVDIHTCDTCGGMVRIDVGTRTVWLTLVEARLLERALREELDFEEVTP